MRKKDQEQTDQPVVREELTEWEQRQKDYEEQRTAWKEEEEKAERHFQKAVAQMEEAAVELEWEEPHHVGENLVKAMPLLLFATIVLVISLYFVLPSSKQKLFAIQGASGTTQEALIENSGIKTTDYIAQVFLNLSKHEKNIVKNDPWVKSAKFDFEFPNRFYLTVEEHEIVAYQQTADGWQPLLSSGDFLPAIDDSLVPEIYLAIYLEDKDQAVAFVEKIAELDEEVRSAITEVRLADSSSTKDLLLLSTTQGHQIRVPLSEVDTKLPYYKTIKNKLLEPRIIDMEVGIYTTTAEIEEAARAAKAKAEEEAKTAENSEEQLTEEGQEPAEDLLTGSQEQSDEVIANQANVTEEVTSSDQ